MTFCFCSDVSLGFRPTLPEVVPLIIRSSFAVCSKLREHADTLILIVSSRTGKEDKLNGFDLGADDYIEKPYDIDILIAKIKGIFKRRYQCDTLSADGVTLNFADKTAVIDGKSVELPAKEFELLALLIGNQGKTLRKEYLFGTVWGSDNNSELQTLHVHINRLRQKLGDDPKNTKRLLTVWGVGYKFV
ncbi:MAG: response regulator transcription factor [Lachnospiraceae bacterium]|nr:response regulator transcription factor [Lachnospiraceae bacterium]